MHTKLVLTIVLILAASVSTAAQSTDQSSPTPIGSNELTIAGPKKNNENLYYSFTAGPGEVTLQLSVKAKSSATFVGLKVFDAELNTLTYHNMSADTAPSMALKKFEVGARQTLVLSFNSDASLGECKIKFGGAVEFGGNQASSSAAAELSSTPTSTATNSAPEVQPVEQGSGAGSNGKNKNFVFSILDAVGQRFNIPAAGRLRVEMKDGSVQEIDLTQVKKILVKQ